MTFGARSAWAKRGKAVSVRRAPAAAAMTPPAARPTRIASINPALQRVRRSARARAQTAANSQLPGGGGALGSTDSLVILFDASVAHAHHPVGGVGDVLVMGDEEYG